MDSSGGVALTGFAEIVAARPALREAAQEASETKIEAREFSFFYGTFQALHAVNLAIPARQITALIGPSGCGKSTLLRAMNRMHDRTLGAHSTGQLCIDGVDLYGPDIDPIKLRRLVGMVFQKPNPFAISIFDNVAYGLRLIGVGRRELPGRVEQALRRAALWDEVKDKLKQPGTALSGGQQQRLCIARAIAPEPDVLLMDEPCSALDPIATARIEELIHNLRGELTIAIVTHNMQQAARVSDYTTFMLANPATRAGGIVEFSPTVELFTRPRDQRTEDYISGRFG